MRYRLEVRNSREVKFALEVFSSLNSNNFVRFFKLLKSASYLNACIIHRYFTQVRRSALRVMTRAYTPNSPYPLRVLQDLLAFEDKHEVRMTFFFIILSAILGSRVKSYIRVPVNSKERHGWSELNVHCMCPPCVGQRKTAISNHSLCSCICRLIELQIGNPRFPYNIYDKSYVMFLGFPVLFSL
jgi:hypothetical protein